MVRSLCLSDLSRGSAGSMSREWVMTIVLPAGAMVAQTAGPLLETAVGAEGAGMMAVGAPVNVAGAGRVNPPTIVLGPAVADRVPPWPPATTGESVGISRSAGGGMGVATHGA